jgi:hypothetical protein
MCPERSPEKHHFFLFSQSILDLGGSFLHTKSLAESLNVAYNSLPVIKEKSKSYKKAQAMLKAMLNTLFSNEGD